MSEVILLDKTKDNDPVTGTPIQSLTFSWTDFYGQAKSNEGRYYQIFVPSYDADHPGVDNFKKMEADSNLVMTKSSDE